MKKIKFIKQKLFITFALLAYSAALYILPFSCIFKEILGFKCPGCGMTRALIALIRFDFKAAFEYHFMVWSVPILYLCFLYDGKPFKNKYANIILYAVLALGFAVNWIFNTNV